MSRGNIRQRSRVRKDSWTVQVFLGVDPETGKKRYHSEAVRGSKADAERRLNRAAAGVGYRCLLSAPPADRGPVL